jgi:hypothetical protein
LAGLSDEKTGRCYGALVERPVLGARGVWCVS